MLNLDSLPVRCRLVRNGGMWEIHVELPGWVARDIENELRLTGGFSAPDFSDGEEDSVVPLPVMVIKQRLPLFEK